MPHIRIGNELVHYQDEGTGETLLLIHGLGTSCQDWEPQIASFRERYRVLAYDLRGHGASGKSPRRYDMKSLAADAAGLLDALHAAPAHVLGLSLGGAVAFQLLADHPAKVRSVIIVNSGPELILRTAGQRFAIWTRRVIVRLGGTRAMGKVLAPRLFPRDDQAQLRQAFVDRVGATDRGSYLRALRALVGWSVSQWLPRMNRPALIIASEHDYSPVELKRRYAAMMPSAEVQVIPGARHAVSVEKPGEFNRVVDTFLERLRRPAQRDAEAMA